MALKKPKAKGDAFQRKIAGLLSEKLSPWIFISTSQSGGRVGGKNFEKVGHKFGQDTLSMYAGDLACSNESTVGSTFPFTVECKHYATPPTLMAVIAGSGDMPKWWSQASADAEKCNKHPMMIVQWNRTKTLVVIGQKAALQLMIPPSRISLICKLPGLGRVCMCEFETFPWEYITAGRCLLKLTAKT